MKANCKSPIRDERLESSNLSQDKAFDIENKMKSVCTEITNGIIFVLDSKNKDVCVPQYVNDELISKTDSCVSIGAQAPVDGSTKISIGTSEDDSTGLNLVSSEKVFLPFGNLSVVNAEFEILVESKVIIGWSSISIWVDDVSAPANILLRIENKSESMTSLH